MEMRLLAFALLLASAYAAEKCSCSKQVGLQTVFTGSNKFSRDFGTAVLENRGNENVVFSSLGIYLLLSMIYYGASGKTAEELKKAMQYPDSCCRDSIKDFLKQLHSQPKTLLDFGSKVYVREGRTVKKTFKNYAQDVLNSSVGTIKDPSKAVAEVNKWVSEKTNNKITSLLNYGEVTSLTEAILLNFVYFNAKWKFPFTSAGKVEFNNYNKIIQTPMMKQTNIFYCDENSKLDGSLVISLPYENNDFNMIIIVPKDIDHFYKVGKQLKNFDYINVLKDLKENFIELIMPKFKVETTLELQPILEKMNVKNLFENTDYIFEAGHLKRVNQMRQKATIIVDENGTEAGAAAVAVFGFRARFPVIVINKPFYYILHSKTVQGPVFQGKIMTPIAP